MYVIPQNFLRATHQMQSFEVPSAQAMLELGRGWAGRLGAGAVVFLAGALGAGKTTLARGILRGMGHHGAVTSPTYTLLERYALPNFEVIHGDLYRLDHPAELDAIGLRDMLDGRAILLLEWPHKGRGHLPPPSIEVAIDFCDPTGPALGRRVQVSAAGLELPGLG